MIRTRDGRMLHVVEREGIGGMPVVAESGMADGNELWAPVEAALAGAAPFVRYDRAGLGRSPADPRPRTVRRMADDLADLLGGLGPGPYVLVGHSIGGPICRVAAQLAPVAAMVLIDPTDETVEGFYSPLMASMVERTVAELPEQARTGVLRARYGERLRGLPAELADAAMPAVIRSAGAVAEYRAFVHGLAEVRDAPPARPPIPVTVLSAAGPNARPELVAAHARFVAALPAGRHVRVAGAEHDIHLQHPDLVAAEIVRVRAAVASQA